MSGSGSGDGEPPAPEPHYTDQPKPGVTGALDPGMLKRDSAGLGKIMMFLLRSVGDKNVKIKVRGFVGE